MTRPRPPGLSSEEMAATLAAYAEAGCNAAKAAELLSIARSTVSNRLHLARQAGLVIPEKPPLQAASPLLKPDLQGVASTAIQDGVLVVGSDAHFWPDLITPAYSGFLWALDKFRVDGDLRGCCLNGDAMDCADLSRFPPLGWEEKPDTAAELGAVQHRSREIRDAGGEIPYWLTWGNHDMRFDTKIAHLIPELQTIFGASLKDHLPDWSFSMLVSINDAQVVVKHRFRGGIHATYNNVLHSGTTIVTGHLHNANVRPHSNYIGTHWGVDCGTLAAPYGPQFRYTELNPVNWRGAFAVLSWYNGRLLQPELAMALDEHHIDFRGRIHEV
jgi:PucR C-terminal helix-turn-helix domain